MNKDKKLNIRVSCDTLNKLKELAELENRSQGNWIETIIEKEYKKLKGDVKMELMVKYVEWRKISEEMLEDGFSGSLDCGEQIVREDFSNFAKLEQEITFEEMLKLENEYEYENK